MLKGAVAGRYSAALYELAVKIKEVDRVEDELKMVAAAIKENEDLQKIIYHPQITVADKKELLDKLFKGKILPLTSNFIGLLLDRRRENYLGDIVDEFVAQANKDRNIVAARISSAVELNNAEKDAIDQLLAKITGMKVQSSYTVDPSLRGGVLMRFGDKVIDGTIKARLDTMADSLRKIS
ncbi:MAG: F0F1 ATP synthase subunit delta [Desulfotomaculaceae bacterium]|nr:F0F1 ATP synthase subunit delta [Desulfotomaculaceae bacterium]